MLAELEETGQRWTPQLVHLWLMRYRLLVVAETTGIVRAIAYHDEAGGGSGDPHRLLDIKADIDRALLRLNQMDEDPQAAMWIWECYVRGRPITQIAQDDGYTPGWVGEALARGRKRMAAILGYYYLTETDE